MDGLRKSWRRVGGSSKGHVVIEKSAGGAISGMLCNTSGCLGWVREACETM